MFSKFSLTLTIGLVFVSQLVLASVIPAQPTGGNIVGNSDKPFDKNGCLISSGICCQEVDGGPVCSREAMDARIVDGN